MTRKVVTFITPQTDREWPENHPLRSSARVAGIGEMKAAELLICRRQSDPPPDDVATAVEFGGACQDCGEPVFHRALPNPTVRLICIYCWHDLAKGSR